MSSLKDKNIVISGASSGIGKACAAECSRAGAKVHMIGRNIAALTEAAAELGDNIHSINQLDVTKTDDIEATIKNIVDEHGKIDGFIHSAGIQKTQAFRSITRDHYIEVFSVNTIAAFDLSRVLLKKQYCNPNGISLVFIASVMSVAGYAGLTSYCASKAALVGGARSMAVELAAKNVRVNCVSPGTVKDTAMTQGLQSSISEDEFQKIVAKYPSGLGQAKDVANLCVFLLSEDSKWITGQNIVIDGGYSSL